MASNASQSGRNNKGFSRDIRDRMYGTRSMERLASLDAEKQPNLIYPTRGGSFVKQRQAAFLRSAASFSGSQSNSPSNSRNNLRQPHDKTSTSTTNTTNDQNNNRDTNKATDASNGLGRSASVNLPRIPSKVLRDRGLLKINRQSDVNKREGSRHEEGQDGSERKTRRLSSRDSYQQDSSFTESKQALDGSASSNSENKTPQDGDDVMRRKASVHASKGQTPGTVSQDEDSQSRLGSAVTTSKSFSGYSDRRPYRTSSYLSDKSSSSRSSPATVEKSQSRPSSEVADRKISTGNTKPLLVYSSGSSAVGRSGSSSASLERYTLQNRSRPSSFHSERDYSLSLSKTDQKGNGAQANSSEKQEPQIEDLSTSLREADKETEKETSDVLQTFSNSSSRKTAEKQPFLASVSTSLEADKSPSLTSKLKDSQPSLKMDTSDLDFMSSLPDILPHDDIEDSRGRLLGTAKMTTFDGINDQTKINVASSANDEKDREAVSLLSASPISVIQDKDGKTVADTTAHLSSPLDCSPFSSLQSSALVSATTHTPQPSTSSSDPASRNRGYSVSTDIVLGDLDKTLDMYSSASDNATTSAKKKGVSIDVSSTGNDEIQLRAQKKKKGGKSKRKAPTAPVTKYEGNVKTVRKQIKPGHVEELREIFKKQEEMEEKLVLRRKKHRAKPSGQIESSTEGSGSGYSTTSSDNEYDLEEAERLNSPDYSFSSPLNTSSSIQGEEKLPQENVTILAEAKSEAVKKLSNSNEGVAQKDPSFQTTAGYVFDKAGPKIRSVKEGDIDPIIATENTPFPTNTTPSFASYSFSNRASVSDSPQFADVNQTHDEDVYKLSNEQEKAEKKEGGVSPKTNNLLSATTLFPSSENKTEEEGHAFHHTAGEASNFIFPTNISATNRLEVKAERETTSEDPVPPADSIERESNSVPVRSNLHSLVAIHLKSPQISDRQTMMDDHDAERYKSSPAKDRLKESKVEEEHNTGETEAEDKSTSNGRREEEPVTIIWPNDRQHDDTLTQEGRGGRRDSNNFSGRENDITSATIPPPTSRPELFEQDCIINGQAQHENVSSRHTHFISSVASQRETVTPFSTPDLNLGMNVSSPSPTEEKEKLQTNTADFLSILDNIQLEKENNFNPEIAERARQLYVNDFSANKRHSRESFGTEATDFEKTVIESKHDDPVRGATSTAGLRFVDRAESASLVTGIKHTESSEPATEIGDLTQIMSGRTEANDAKKSDSDKQTREVTQVTTDLSTVTCSEPTSLSVTSSKRTEELTGDDRVYHSSKETDNIPEINEQAKTTVATTVSGMPIDGTVPDAVSFTKNATVSIEPVKQVETPSAFLADGSMTGSVIQPEQLRDESFTSKRDDSHQFPQKSFEKTFEMEVVAGNIGVKQKPPSAEVNKDEKSDSHITCVNIGDGKVGPSKTSSQVLYYSDLKSSEPKPTEDRLPKQQQKLKSANKLHKSLILSTTSTTVNKDEFTALQHDAVPPSLTATVTEGTAEKGKDFLRETQDSTAVKSESRLDQSEREEADPRTTGSELTLGSLPFTAGTEESKKIQFILQKNLQSSQERKTSVSDSVSSEDAHDPTYYRVTNVSRVDGGTMDRSFTDDVKKSSAQTAAACRVFDGDPDQSHSNKISNRSLVLNTSLNSNLSFDQSTLTNNNTSFGDNDSQYGSQTSKATSADDVSPSDEHLYRIVHHDTSLSSPTSPVLSATPPPPQHHVVYKALDRSTRATTDYQRRLLNRSHEAVFIPAKTSSVVGEGRRMGYLSTSDPDLSHSLFAKPLPTLPSSDDQTEGPRYRLVKTTQRNRSPSIDSDEDSGVEGVKRYRTVTKVEAGGVRRSNSIGSLSSVQLSLPPRRPSPPPCEYRVSALQPERSWELNREESRNVGNSLYRVESITSTERDPREKGRRLGHRTGRQSGLLKRQSWSPASRKEDQNNNRSFKLVHILPSQKSSLTDDVDFRRREITSLMTTPNAAPSLSSFDADLSRRDGNESFLYSNSEESCQSVVSGDVSQDRAPTHSSRVPVSDAERQRTVNAKPAAEESSHTHGGRESSGDRNSGLHTTRKLDDTGGGRYRVVNVKPSEGTSVGGDRTNSGVVYRDYSQSISSAALGYGSDMERNAASRERTAKRPESPDYDNVPVSAGDERKYVVYSPTPQSPSSHSSQPVFLDEERVTLREIKPRISSPPPLQQNHDFYERRQYATDAEFVNAGDFRYISPLHHQQSRNYGIHNSLDNIRYDVANARTSLQRSNSHSFTPSERQLRVMSPTPIIQADLPYRGPHSSDLYHSLDRGKRRMASTHTPYRDLYPYDLNSSTNLDTQNITSAANGEDDPGSFRREIYEEKTYEVRQQTTHVMPETNQTEEKKDLRVLRGKILIQNRLDESRDQDDFLDNMNIFDTSFHMDKDNPLYQSDPDIYKSLEEELEKQEEQQQLRNQTIGQEVTQDVTWETVERVAKEHRRAENGPPKRKQNLSTLLLSKLAAIDSKDIHQHIDVKHHHEEIYGDVHLVHADGSTANSAQPTSNFDSVHENIELMLKQGKAFVIIKVIAERIVPIDLEFNVWRKSQAIVTRNIEIDLRATEQRRRLYEHVMETGGRMPGALENVYEDDYGEEHGATLKSSRRSGQDEDERQLTSLETLRLFSQILGVTEGRGGDEDEEMRSRQEIGSLQSPTSVSSGMDLLY